MATFDDVRRIAMALPGATESFGTQNDGLTWRVTSGMFAWERPLRRTDEAALAALGREIPTGALLGIRTDGLDGKEALLGAYPDIFFAPPHFDGYPAVLTRLDRIDIAHLREVVQDSWLLRAPKRVAKAWLEEHAP